MLGELIVYKTEKKRNATADEITELIEDGGLIINYYNSKSTVQGVVWLDLLANWDSVYELRNKGDNKDEN